MTTAVVAVDPPRGLALAAGLAAEGVEVVETVAAHRLTSATAGFAPVDVLVLEVQRATLTAALVAACDRAGIRIVPLCADDGAIRLAEHFGLGAALPLDVEAWVLVDALAEPATLRRRSPAPERGQVVTVWGPHGAPGRSTLAVELAAELSRGGRAVALADADAHAPSIALALGLADEGPGFAAACRQADRGDLDAAELTRISVPAAAASGSIEVLTGINRPGRWPELAEDRVGAVLSAGRSWVDHLVVDVAASLERDEEIVSDLDGPRRNGATLAALRSADRVVAVCAGDPVGVARFLRAHTELRATIGPTPVAVVVNRLRPATLGIDARGQVRRTLERFAGIEDVWFVPHDSRAVEAALLAARPVADVAPRSSFAAAVRRLVGEAVAPVPRPVTRERAGRRARTSARGIPHTA